MKRIIGITGLVVALLLFMSLRDLRLPERVFTSAYNLQNTINWVSQFAILSIGAAFVIITSGIDLSIGSVVALVGCVLPLLLKGGKPVPLAVALTIALAVGIGLAHGLLITKLRLQPFVVTLCGLLLYRGMARYVTGDAEQGFGSQYEGLRSLATGKVPMLAGFQLPVPFFIMAALAIVAAIFLNRTIYGRYLLALGRNEQAALYSGIKTDNMVILSYVICSTCAGLGGIIFALDLNSVQPGGHGNFYELYAIAAAVLGGCSLRGGEGSIMGAIIGTVLIRVLYNAINLLGVPTALEFAVVGIVILLGVVADEVVKLIAARRRMHATSSS
jgi:ribose transport system permease protein